MKKLRQDGMSFGTNSPNDQVSGKHGVILGGILEQAITILEKEHGKSQMKNSEAKLSEIIEKLHTKKLDVAVKGERKQHKLETDTLNVRIKSLVAQKTKLEAKLETESKKLRDICIDAEVIRASLHKEIKDYRIMKKKLKSIILQFGERLEELKHREITREL